MLAIVYISAITLAGWALWVIQERSYVTRNSRGNPRSTVSHGPRAGAVQHDMGRDSCRQAVEAPR